MKYFSLLIFIFFIGCGGSGSKSSSDTGNNTNNSDNEPAVNSSSIINTAGLKAQWYLFRNNEFYANNYINKDASINIGNYINKYRGKGVKIAIIDDGIDGSHRDLDGAIVNTYNVNGTKNVNQDFNEGHGTKVAGVIAARNNNFDILGVASESSIIFLKSQESNLDSEIIELFNKAEEFGADIISCSWGTYDVSDSVREKIVELATNGRNGKGTLIVFASGNENRDMGNDESSIPEVIAVASTNANNKRAYYSNFGANLDILAPGGNMDFLRERGILTLFPNNQYRTIGYVHGTSFSAPIVSGALALLLEANPNLTRVQVEEILKKTNDKIGNLYYDSKGHNNYYGYGKINVSKAIGEALRY